MIYFVTLVYNAKTKEDLDVWRKRLSRTGCKCGKHSLRFRQYIQDLKLIAVAVAPSDEILARAVPDDFPGQFHIAEVPGQEAA